VLKETNSSRLFARSNG